MRTMAELAAEVADGAVTTADIARVLERRPQSLSPARDGLIKKGLVYSSERGTVAFTVPHFGKFLRGQRA
jgi:Mn-dependent DtxR family transcriptional regulator